MHKKIAFANTLRGLACLAVVFNHHYGVFWFGRQTVSNLINAPILDAATYPTPLGITWLNTIPAINWGAYGVALFFLISGFVIPFSLQKTSLIGFLANRFFRIVPTYIAGFSISLFAIYICSLYFSRIWPFNTAQVLIHYLPGLRDILLSKEIDGIVWTLEVETKFYLICAVLILWFRNCSLKVFITPFILFSLGLFLNIRMSGMAEKRWMLTATYMLESQYVIYMFIGVIFNYLYQKRINHLQATLGIMVLFSLFCIQWVNGPYFSSFMIAWSYGLALLTFILGYAFPAAFEGNKVLNFLANISYPLYIVHGILGYAILRLMIDRGFGATFALFIAGCFCLLISWFIHMFIEKPTQHLSKLIAVRLSR